MTPIRSVSPRFRQWPAPSCASWRPAVNRIRRPRRGAGPSDPTPTLNALADATLLIEAIPERLALKHALYAELETLIADEAIIASNTSGLPPDRLAQGMRLPERLLIAHFWHPPHLIPLVEVVPGSATLPHLAREVSDFCAACALEAVVLNRAAPGFVGNRLQFALLREALHIVHSGIASPEVVDQVMRASLGRRYAMVGPLEAADMTGPATVQISASTCCRSWPAARR